MVNKPEISNPKACEEIVQAVRVMSDVRVIHHWGNSHQDVPKKALANQDERISSIVDISRFREIKVIGIASSTGGPSALSAVLGDLPADYPLPILAVQHVSPGFTSGLAEWLRTVVKIQVNVAAHGEKFKRGAIVFAPDDYHLQANSRGETELSRAPAYKGLRPSANPLFESLAHHYGKKSVGIVLTGMGDDGADGLEMLHQAGGLTIAQDRESCVVYGMPREAAVRNAIDAQMSLEDIALFLRRIGEAKKNASKIEAGAL
jgi:two-component system chemotaxis response regulator CheB